MKASELLAGLKKTTPPSSPNTVTSTTRMLTVEATARKSSRSPAPKRERKAVSEVVHIAPDGVSGTPMCGGRGVRGGRSPETSVLTVDRWCSRCLKRWERQEGKKYRPIPYDEAAVLWDAKYPGVPYISRDKFDELRAVSDRPSASE